MLKSPVFTLVVGLMVGLALGYVLAERESIPPPAERPATSQGNLPPGHPPVDTRAHGPMERESHGEANGLLVR